MPVAVSDRHLAAVASEVRTGLSAAAATVLKAGCAWLIGPHPANSGAVISNRGIYYSGFDFIPGVRPVGTCAATTAVIRIAAGWDLSRRSSSGVLRAAELTDSQTIISDSGLAVTSTWGMEADDVRRGWRWRSFAVTGCSAELVEAVERFRHGCPIHQWSPTCAERDGGCSWLETGAAALPLPHWPTT